uniref:Mediator of DNA damage checkpoint protein 1 n=1 Tax=Ceratitis capitata TaxID=7213 RepID=W8BYA8_CERCA
MLQKKWTLSVESKQYHLEAGKLYLIGSSKDGEGDNLRMDIPLKSQHVDIKHCIADVTNNDICIYDLHTELGTFVNDKRLCSMVKECISEDAELRIGDVTAKLSQQSLDDNVIDTFLVPTHTAPRSSLSNTSTRLFSSPDVSLLKDSSNESFNIPETQHHKQRTSIVNSSVLNSTEKELNVEKSFEDDSFIPETQALVEQKNKTLELEVSAHQTNDMIRICTQDFNENLFENGEDDEMLFSSLVIPKIQHKPVILSNISADKQLNKDASSTVDAEMDVLNWSAQTSKNGTLDDVAQTTVCNEREDTTTPDLFDLPEVGQPNLHSATSGLINQVESGPKDVNSNEKATSICNNLLKTVENDGEGYAEEIDLAPTQVFIPIPKQQKAESAVQVDCELSLSGKENLPQLDIDLEETQVFAPNKDKTMTKKTSSISSDSNAASTNEVSEGNCSWLAPTQVFTKKLSNAMPPFKGHEKPMQNPSITRQKASTAVQMERVENPKNLASSEEIVMKSNSNKRKVNSKNDDCFKKPKQSTSSCTSKGNISSICSSQSEMDDLLLCTPKWISDNIDVLPIKQPITVAKRRMLFGSDSEEESVELNKLDVKKDSKDFDMLLSNVKEGKLEKKIEKPKSLQVKKEVITNINNAIKTKKKQVGHEGNSVQSDNSPVGKTDSNAKKTVHDDTAKVERKQETEKKVEGAKKKRTRTPSAKVVKSTEEEAEPVRRITRLKSRTCEKEDEKGNTSLSGPSQAKLRKTEQTDSIEQSKKRVTRSRSKTDSQESVSSTKKSTSSASSTSKGKGVLEKEARKKIDSDNEKKKKKSEPSKSAKDTKLKSSTDGSSDDEFRKLRSNSRTLQIAKTMVDEEVFQILIENSSGKWCVASDPTDADVLVMDKGNRTLKFLIAMAKGIPIVTTKWLESFNATKIIPRGITYFFRDHDFEKRHKFSLLKSLELARNRKLFEGYEFFTTPSISPAPAEMKQILECAGGIVHNEPQPPKKDKKIYLVSTMNDKKYWHKYRHRNCTIHIINSEGVMTAVMRQIPTLLDSYIFA